MEYPCSPLNWDDDPSVRPVCSTCCYIPQRHRGFFRDQLSQLPIYDQVVKELCHCQGGEGEGDSESCDLHHENGNNRDDEVLSDLNHVSVSPTWSSGDESLPSNVREKLPSYYQTPLGFGSRTPRNYEDYGGASKFQPWHRNRGQNRNMDSSGGFQPNTRWPETGYWNWRKYSQSRDRYSKRPRQYYQNTKDYRHFSPPEESSQKTSYHRQDVT